MENFLYPLISIDPHSPLIDQVLTYMYLLMESTLGGKGDLKFLIFIV